MTKPRLHRRVLARLLGLHRPGVAFGLVKDLMPQLRAAALAAIVTLGRADRTDPNSATGELTPYDLASIFCVDSGGQVVAAGTLDDLAATVTNTSSDPDLRGARTRWVAHELHRLGQPSAAERFAELANHEEAAGVNRTNEGTR